jgi:hypothetical protein
MCQSQHRQSQYSARHLADKIGSPPKKLPWTDKFCHFVRFEPPTDPKTESLRMNSCPSNIRTQPLDKSGIRSPPLPPSQSSGGCVMCNLKIRVHPCQSVATSSHSCFRQRVVSHQPRAPANQSTLLCVFATLR